MQDYAALQGRFNNQDAADKALPVMAQLRALYTTHRASVDALVTAANLRGVKESGTWFAIPTYGFMIGVLAMVVVVLFSGGRAVQ